MNQMALETRTDTLEITKDEYKRLKGLEKTFSQFLSFAEHASDVRRSREDIKRGRGVKQEELFKELGV